MKRGLLGLSLLVLLTRVISAQFYSGYGSFSLTNFFDRIDPQTIILVLLFLIFFALIFYALSRIFKDPYGQPNKGIAGVISFAVTSLIIYGLYRTGFDLGSIFYDLGFSVDLLYPILGVLFLIIAGLLIWKLGFGRFLMTFGLFIILLTAFTEIFYEKGLVLIIGIVLLVVGLLLWRRGRKAMRGLGRGIGWTSKKAWGGAKAVGRGAKWVGSKYDWEKEKRQANVIGRGIGKGIAKIVGGTGREIEELPRRKFEYSQGMRRGGLKPTRGRFASKKAIERYARRFGTEAAKKRFG